MRTVSIISQKGGAGKTTLALHLATAASQAGIVSLLVDTDPQATLSRWSGWRSGRDPEVVDCGAPSLLAAKLARAVDLGAALIVIDTPPHAEAMARQAAQLADLILVPCRPKAFDLAAVETTAELVEASRKPGYVVFMAGPPRGRLVYAEASDLIRGVGLAVAPIVLPERAAFHHSTAAGATAAEINPNGKAAAEIAALWTWVTELIEPLGAQGARAPVS
jgi:chromosome partitioning protein